MKNINEKAKRVLALVMVLLFALPLLCSCAGEPVGDPANTATANVDTSPEKTDAIGDVGPTEMPYVIADGGGGKRALFSLKEVEELSVLIVTGTVLSIEYRDYYAPADEEHLLLDSVVTLRAEKIFLNDENHKINVGDEVLICESFRLIPAGAKAAYDSDTILSSRGAIPTQAGKTYLYFLDECPYDTYPNLYWSVGAALQGRFLVTDAVKNAKIAAADLTDSELGFDPQKTVMRDLALAVRAKYILGKKD